MQSTIQAQPSRCEIEIHALADRLLNDFEQTGTFGQTLYMCPIWDELFTKRDWWIFFKRVPRMRIAMLLFIPIYLFFRSPRRQGFSLVANPKSPLAFPHHSFFNDLLVWEALFQAKPWLTMEARERINKGSLSTLMALRGKGRLVNQDGFSFEMFGYFYPINPSTPRKGVFKFLAKVMDVAVPDNDTNSVVFSASIQVAALLKYDLGAQWQEDWAECMRFLKAHQYGKGRYGSGPLSYENGSDASDAGVVTWILEESNEVDPSANVNILGFIASIYPSLNEELQGVAQTVARGIFEFLDRHACSGKLMTQRFQQYYPMGSAIFFWHRFEGIWKKQTKVTQQCLDPLGRFESIHQGWKAWAGKLFLESPKKFNCWDLNMVGSFLHENGILDCSLHEYSLDLPSELLNLDNIEWNHILYPVRMTCASRGLLLAAHLKTKLTFKDRSIFVEK
jgi:hypothetical protein